MKRVASYLLTLQLLPMIWLLDMAMGAGGTNSNLAVRGEPVLCIYRNQRTKEAA